MRIRHLSVVAALLLASMTAARAQEELDPFAEALRDAGVDDASATEAPYRVPDHSYACVGGMADDTYPCSNIDMMAFMPQALFTPAGGSVKTNSLWGWTDPLDGKEYVLLGLNNGTAFIDISIPDHPVYLGKLPSHNGITSTWRDVREHANHAYVVVDNGGAHGVQVFDLTQLRDVVNPPVTFSETAHYAGVTNVHTISITKESGYAYLAGSSACSGNLHILNLANPASPVAAPGAAGCYDDDADDPANTYVHENQCFIYHGPDTSCDHDANAGTPPVNCQGREICLAARGGTHKLDILDATNRAAEPTRLDSLQYNATGYSHQAWFTDDHRYILLNDETDESSLGHGTRTWIFDALDLDNLVPAGIGYYQHATAAIDHNLYVRGNYVFESNYRAGLRILELTNLATAQLTEVGYFDLYPSSDSASFNGTWNNYPFFASGVIPVSHIEQGLFLLKPTNLCGDPASPTGLGAVANGVHRIDLDWTGSGAPGATFRVERAPGGCAGTFEQIASGLTSPSYDDLTASGGVAYGYRVREVVESGLCPSEPSGCVEASTTGSCTAAPAFAGVASATNGGTIACAIDLDWSAAQPFCGGPVGYSVYRDASPDFQPSPSSRIAEGVSGTAFTDFGALPGVTSHYVVRATDAASGAEDENLARRFAAAGGPPVDGAFATGAELGDPDLDTGEAGSFAPEHAGWHIVDNVAHLGVRSFWSADSANMCGTLEGTFELSAGQSPVLSFFTRWDVAAGDGGVVELSTNGGADWTVLTPVGGYPGTIASGGTLCGIPQGPAFAGLGQSSWSARTINLSSWAGQTVRIRWNYRTDGTATGNGWHIDDVAITHVQEPGSCASSIFLDGFEGGDTDAWSDAVVQP